MNILFPVLTIERLCLKRCDRARVDAIDVHADAIRMRPGDIEGFYAAVATKIVLGHPGVEGVGLDGVLTAQQSEFVFVDEHVQIAGHAADTAIAL